MEIAKFDVSSSAYLLGILFDVEIALRLYKEKARQDAIGARF